MVGALNMALLLRRPSNPVLIAISASIILILLFFQISHTGVPARASKFITGGSESSDLNDIYNSTLGFEKILVVSLPYRSDRRDAMALSAALTNIEIEFVDGVLGSDVPDKVIPVSKSGHNRMGNAVIGCWRSHMDALRMVVQQNLSSVLILEDDADWDVRLKNQLHDLALASHALTQPLTRNPLLYADTTFPKPQDKSSKPEFDLSFDRLPSTVPPRHSPYGDNWNFFWMGHCGMRFPSAAMPSPDKIPKGRVVQHDTTVPKRKYLDTISNPDDLKDQYPEHTRVYSHTSDGICSLGYAVTQAGARKLLHDIGLFDVTEPYDILLRQYCEGSGGRRYNICLTMQPALFQHHRPAGNKTSESDITSHGTEFREKAVTNNLKWSTILNWNVLLDGRTDFEDQFPDS